MSGFIHVLTFTLIFCAYYANSSIMSKVKQDHEQQMGKCQCSVFSTKEPKEGDDPMLIFKEMNVTCPSDDSCKKMCTGLAIAYQAAKTEGHTLFCARVGHVDELYASVFLRACDAKTWTYTGWSCPEPICCHDNHPTPCKKEVEKKKLDAKKSEEDKTKH